MWVLAFVGCEPAAPPLDDAAVVRISIALRGVRPTLGELRALREDPTQLDARIAEWMADPRFGATVRDLHSEVYQFRLDDIEPYPSVGDLEGEWPVDMYLSRQEAPLRLIERVVTDGRPYTEILTADYTMTDARLAVMEGMAFDPAGPEWQVSMPSDGRPVAGILSTTGLLQRWLTNTSGKHRNRANLVTRAVLCDEIGDQDVPVFPVFDPTDDAALADTLSTDPACVYCHEDLDPLAAYFWGFKLQAFPTDLDPYPLAYWKPEAVGNYEDNDLPPPGYFGTPGGTFVDLGRFLADDPRFPTCAVTQAWRFFVGDPHAEVPARLAEHARSALLLSGWDWRAMARTLVASEEFRSAPRLQLRPEAYQRYLQDVTGSVWTYADAEWGPVDVLASARTGARDLAGGTDQLHRDVPNVHPSPTELLAWQAAAHRAAEWAVQRGELLDPRLAAPDAVDRQLAALVERVAAREVGPDDPQVAALRDLFAAAIATEPVEAAWTETLAALLADPATLTY